MTIVLALTGALLFGVSDIIGGIASRQRSPIVVAAWFHVAAVMFVLVVVLLRERELPPVDDVVLGGLSGICTAATYLLYLLAIRRGRLAVVTPVLASFATGLPVVVSLLGGEHLGTWPLVGLLVTVLAIPAVASAGHDTSVADPWPLPLQLAAGAAAGASGGLFFILIGETSDGSGSWPILAGFAVATVVCWAAVAVQRVSPGRPSRSLVAIGLAVGGADVALGEALQRGPVAVASVIGNLYPLVVAVLAAVVLHERVGRLQAAGVAVSCAGVALLSATT